MFAKLLHAVQIFFCFPRTIGSLIDTLSNKFEQGRAFVSLWSLDSKLDFKKTNLLVKTANLLSRIAHHIHEDDHVLALVEHAVPIVHRPHHLDECGRTPQEYVNSRSIHCLLNDLVCGGKKNVN